MTSKRAVPDTLRDLKQLADAGHLVEIERIKREPVWPSKLALTTYHVQIVELGAFAEMVELADAINKLAGQVLDPSGAYTCDTCKVYTWNSSGCDHCDKVHCSIHDCGNFQCNETCIHKYRGMDEYERNR